MPFDGTQLSNATQLLIEGKKLIEEHGWCQGRYQIGARVCMLAALKISGDAYQQAHMLLYEAVDRCCIAVWNDASGRTKDEVLAAYDRAIAASISHG